MIPPFAHFKGLAYRAHHPAWAFDPESGAGAALRGGRFNPVGTPCFYAALSLNTAWLEAQQGLAFKAQPATLCTYRVDSSDILDLTDAAIRRSCDITLAELGCRWMEHLEFRQPVPSHEVASRLRAAGCVGILVPSFARRAGKADVNLVMWDWSRDPPHRIEVIDDEDRLPANQDSWPKL